MFPSSKSSQRGKKKKKNYNIVANKVTIETRLKGWGRMEEQRRGAGGEGDDRR